jgi:signal peptidase
MKTKTIIKWASNFITILLFLVLILMLFVVITFKLSGGEPQVLGYQLKTVLSGSMEPGIKTGSIIAVKSGGDMTRFKKGEVISFITEERVLVTHRIVEVINNGEQVSYRTKGDKNKDADADSVLSNNVIAKYTGFTVPYVGYIANFSKTKQGIAFLMFLPGILLIGYSGFTIWTTISQLLRKNDKSTEKDTIEKPV